LTQEVVVKEAPAVILVSQELKQSEKKKQMSIQELVESLKSTADDIGQISELSSEEKILVAQFFSSLLKLMQPLALSIAVDQLALPAELGNVVQAHIDPTGHLILQFEDGHLELKDLSEEKNRDLMTAVIGDVMPKFKNLTSQQKHKLENRIKLLSSITKEIQKSSEALSAAISADQ
jgi:proline dehydrogenase